MSQPAATVTSQHICPQSDGPKPHVGGAIIAGSPDVFVEKKPISRQGDQLVCVSPAPNSIAAGSPTVFVNGKPAARMGDSTQHGGQITTGAATIFIG